MKKCNYPNCFNCEHEDCIMEENDLKKKEEEANCDKCDNCFMVESENGGTFQRACKLSNRIIGNSITVSKSPFWCKLRKESDKFVFNLEDVECGFVCPNCKSKNQLVKDSRDVDGHRIRRRQCVNCETNWNTVEVLYRHGYSDKTYI